MAYLFSYLGSDAPKRPPAIFAGSRDAQQGPQHSVIAIDGGSMQLGPSLTQFPVGQYRLSLTPLPASAVAPTRVDLTWDGHSASIPSLPPGFYALDAYEINGDHVGSHAALLLVPASDVAAQQRWQQALAAIQDAAGPDTVLADKLRLATVMALRDRDLR